MNAQRLSGLVVVPLLLIAADGAAQPPPEVWPKGAQPHVLEFAACRPGVDRVGGGATTCRKYPDNLIAGSYDENFFVEKSAIGIEGHPSCTSPLANPQVPPWYVPGADGGGWVQPPRRGNPLATPITYQTTADNNLFVYRVYFNIPDDPNIFSAVDIGGSVAADDQVTVVLNGASSQGTQLLDCPSASNPNQDCRTSRMLYRSSDKTRLRQGKNDITFTVKNTPIGTAHTGLYATFFFTGTCPTTPAPPK